MGVLFNHAVAYFTSPLSIGVLALIVGIIFLLKNKKRIALCSIAFSLVWLWFFSCEVSYLLLGARLERMYPPESVESLPQADAVVVLGGGVGSCTNLMEYTEMYTGADRVIHGARIVKAGKAPIVIVSGNEELASSLPLLLEAGVTRDKIVVENVSRNTEENARFVCDMLKKRTKVPRILLVTSSWHMRRALLMFSRYADGMEVIPAPIDYESLVTIERGCDISWFFPSADALFRNSMMVKECIGYWGYKILR
ncbi:MAG: YdcF family protein [Kiritimatiellae bacterium]|jgi:uncharacterized SAM-binding protein YcdF (DUF218 family)|nr:YdcF family protein [Kiritimatiellia bacterium]